MVEDESCIIGGCTDSTSAGYLPAATYDDGSCPVVYLGCTDSEAPNYRPLANTDDGSCEHAGCLESAMLNYDATATVSGKCVPYTDGCTAPDAENFASWANRDDGTCKFVGCTDSERSNYNPSATEDDGTCNPLFYGCTDPEGANHKIEYTSDDGSCSYGGCMIPTDEAYNAKATFDDGTCAGGSGRRALSSTCRDPAASNYEDVAACSYLILGCTTDGAINYLEVAEQDRVPNDCIMPSYGCTISADTLNFDSGANMLLGCVYVANGCTDSSATNYVASANRDDETCRYDVLGCTSASAMNYDSLATVLLAGSCTFQVVGCFDPTAHNYAPDANTACESCCEYITRGCMSMAASNYDSTADLDDGSCIVLSPPPSPPPPSLPPLPPVPPMLPPPRPPTSPPPSLPPVAPQCGPRLPPSSPFPSPSFPPPRAPPPSSSPADEPVFMTVVTLTAAGSVDDYTPAVRSSIIRAFAEGAGASESDVTLIVTPASVRLSVSIASPTRAAAEAIQTAITPLLSSTSAASAFLPSGLAAETVPEIQVVESGRGGSSAAEIPIAAIAGAAGGAVLLLVVGVILFLAWHKLRLDRITLSVRHRFSQRDRPSHMQVRAAQRGKVLGRHPAQTVKLQLRV